MFRHYFRTSTRVLLRYKLYSIINILGLAIGMGGCLPKSLPKRLSSPPNTLSLDDNKSKEPWTLNAT